MLRHPAVWVGLAGTALLGYPASTQTTTQARSTWRSPPRCATLLLASPWPVRRCSPASTSRSAKTHPWSAGSGRRRRLLGGLWLVGLMLVVVVVGAIAMATGAASSIGDEPGRLTGIGYSVPEMAQPVLLAGYAVVIGAVAGHLIRVRAARLNRPVRVLAPGRRLFWLWIWPGLRYLTPLQIFPFYEDQPGVLLTNPANYPSDWILSAPSGMAGRMVPSDRVPRDRRRARRLPARVDPPAVGGIDLHTADPTAAGEHRSAAGRGRCGGTGHRWSLTRCLVQPGLRKITVRASSRLSAATCPLGPPRTAHG